MIESRRVDPDRIRYMMVYSLTLISSYLGSKVLQPKPPLGRKVSNERQIYLSYLGANSGVRHHRTRSPVAAMQCNEFIKGGGGHSNFAAVPN